MDSTVEIAGYFTLPIILAYVIYDLIIFLS
mgnify:CR=1 FL=1